MTKAAAALMEQVLELVRTERTVQDLQWGGPEHDAEHELTDWITFVEKQLGRADMAAARANDTELIRRDRRAALVEWRERMVKVAALAVAAVEALDRAQLAAGDDRGVA